VAANNEARRTPRKNVLVQQLRWFGATDRQIRRARARQPGGKRRRKNCKVWPVNWDAVQLFLRVTTQIRYAGLSGWPTGIEHQAVWRVIEEFDRDRGDDGPPGYRLALFDAFRVMESEAITALQERHKQSDRGAR
jgi:hypothetical protein